MLRIDDLHVFSLSPGKNVLLAEIETDGEDDVAVLRAIHTVCTYEQFSVKHVTASLNHRDRITPRLKEL